MKCYVHWLGVVSASSLVALAACGGATSTDVTTPPDTTAASSGSSGATGSSGASGTSGSSGATGSSGTSGTGADAGTASAFSGAPAYVPTTGRNTLKPGEHPGNGNPSKRACLECHGPGGDGPRFFAAGSIFKDAAGTTPAPQIEVRLRTDSGDAISTYTDTLGNFVVTASAANNAGLAFPLHAGARNGTTVELMSMALPNGDCNNSACHGGSQGWIHVP